MVDFGIYIGGMFVEGDELDEKFSVAISMGVISFKIFMAYARRGMKLEDEQILRIMEILAKKKALLAVHAENGSILDYLEDKFVAQGNIGTEYYPLSHPNISEAEAIFRILAISEVTGCPVYLAHVSTRESLDVIRLSKRWGKAEFFTETCTHYLTLTEFR